MACTAGGDEDLGASRRAWASTLGPPSSPPPAWLPSLGGLQALWARQQQGQEGVQQQLQLPSRSSTPPSTHSCPPPASLLPSQATRQSGTGLGVAAGVEMNPHTHSLHCPPSCAGATASRGPSPRAGAAASQGPSPRAGATASQGPSSHPGATASQGPSPRAGATASQGPSSHAGATASQGPSPRAWGGEAAQEVQQQEPEAMCWMLPPPPTASPSPAASSPGPTTGSPGPATADPSPATTGPIPATAGPSPATTGPLPATAGPAAATGPPPPGPLPPYPPPTLCQHPVTPCCGQGWPGHPALHQLKRTSGSRPPEPDGAWSAGRAVVREAGRGIRCHAGPARGGAPCSEACRRPGVPCDCV